MPEKSKSSINPLFIIGAVIIVVTVAAVYFFNQTPSRPKSDTTIREASTQEETGDCFIPKKGDTECTVDAVDVKVERVPTGNECRGVRAIIQVDTELVALDLKLQGEVVIQLHPKDQTNDGSADSGVGMSYRGGKWNIFSFGPGGSKPAEGMFSGEIDGQNVILQLDSFADGSCIADDSEMRIKLEMAEGPTGERVYDIVGYQGGLMDYLPLSRFTGSTR